MKFHEFGKKEDPCIILIHGMLTPWQMWEMQIEYFKENYFVIVPALDAHTEDEASEYISAEDEAEKIIKHVTDRHGKDIFLLAGLSMGGVVANKIFESGRLRIKHLVLDGAPLVPAPKIMENMMIKNYISIIHGSRARDKRVLEGFKKHFMPEKFLPMFLRFVDTMSDSSVSNIVKSACRCEIHKPEPSDTKILFLHGTKINEMLAKKAASKMRKIYPNVTAKACKGYAHGELAIYHPREWYEMVSIFLK